MLKRLSLAVAMAGLAAACSSTPAATGGTTTTTGGGTVPLTPPVFSAPALNIAGSSQWEADERLMPQDPILALINTGGSVDQPAGFYMVCNPANGSVTARLGKQPTARVGQTAVYRLRMGAEAKVVEGKFESNPKSPDADFVFPLSSADLRTMARMDMVSLLTDQGEVQWTFVKDPAAQVQAKYIASLKNMPQQVQDFVSYCNPK